MRNTMSVEEGKPFHNLAEEIVALRGLQRGEGYVIERQQFWHGNNTFTMTNTSNVPEGNGVISRVR